MVLRTFFNRFSRTTVVENNADTNTDESSGEKPTTLVMGTGETPMLYAHKSSTMEQNLREAAKSQPGAGDQAGDGVATSEEIRQFTTVPGQKETFDFSKIATFVEVPLELADGAEVLYFNFGLNEEITRPDVPGDRVLTDAKKENLRTRFGLRVSEKRDAEFKGYADKYWHSNAFADRIRIGGSGRACVLPTGESLKGIGPTPLATPPRHTDPSYGHGKLGLKEALMETVYGELLAHLLGNNSTRVLAIIGTKDPVAPVIIVRAGNLVRPAHFDQWPKNILGTYKKLLRMGSTISQAMQLQAESAAAMGQYRVLHGGLDPSNMGTSGTQIDLGTMTTQPRTEPITNMRYMTHPAATTRMRSSRLNRNVFGAEHKAFAKYLKQIFPPWSTSSWKSIYRKAKNIETLMGCGLKKEVAKKLLQQEPDKAHKLAKHIRRLGRWYHDNVPDTLPEPGKKWGRSALADNHKMMAELPGVFFDRATGEATAAGEPDIHATLDVDTERKDAKLSRGQLFRKYIPLKKYGVSNKEKGDAVIQKSIAEVHTLYPELMEKAAAIGIKDGAYADRKEFVASLDARAQFENAPIESMYSPDIIDRLDKLIASYGEDNDYDELLRNLSRDLPDLIDSIVSDSKRRIDDMLFNTRVRAGSDEDTWRLQMENIDGILHYVEADKNGGRDVCLEIPLDTLSEGELAAVMDAAQANPECQWTGTMPPTSTATVSVQGTDPENGVLKVRIPSAPYQYGQFAGTFKFGDEEFTFPTGSRKYSYAVPDSEELGVILKNVKKAEPEVLAKPKLDIPEAEEWKSPWFPGAFASGSGTDPHKLQRFRDGHAGKESGKSSYHEAHTELQNGKKLSHWMWYMFPMMQGLGVSDTSAKYEISSLEEARAYLADPVLGKRLRDCANLVDGHLQQGESLEKIFGGSTDAWKFLASMTLFAEASKGSTAHVDKVFQNIVNVHGAEIETSNLLQALAASTGL